MNTYDCSKAFQAFCSMRPGDEFTTRSFCKQNSIPGGVPLQRVSNMFCALVARGIIASEKAYEGGLRYNKFLKLRDVTDVERERTLRGFLSARSRQGEEKGPRSRDAIPLSNGALDAVESVKALAAKYCVLFKQYNELQLKNEELAAALKKLQETLRRVTVEEYAQKKLERIKAFLSHAEP